MTILQRSEDWHADRCGKVTASRIKDVDAKPIKGKAHNALTLTILTERLTGVQEETKTNSLMQWGIDQEPYAIAAYENETGNFVVGTGKTINGEWTTVPMLLKGRMHVAYWMPFPKFEPKEAKGEQE